MIDLDFIKPVEIQVEGTPRKFDLNDPELPKWVRHELLECGNYPYDKKLDRKVYEEHLEALQMELVKLQAWLQTTGERVMIVFEGRDAAGKGGSIKTLTQYLNPRPLNIVALSKPNDRERGEWYYQRYIKHFPTDGEMVLFDRSWYNRGGVEPVMGFCSDEEHKIFLDETPRFEHMITRERIRLFKFWLNVGQEMQLKRFHDRRHNPLKVWKLSPIDLKALTRWDRYSEMRNLMIEKTHTEHAPWTIVRSNDKRRARLHMIQHLLLSIEYEDRNTNIIGKIDPEIIGTSGLAFFDKHDD